MRSIPLAELPCCSCITNNGTQHLRRPCRLQVLCRHRSPNLGCDTQPSRHSRRGEDGASLFSAFYRPPPWAKPFAALCRFPSPPVGIWDCKEGCQEPELGKMLCTSQVDGLTFPSPRPASTGASLCCLSSPGLISTIHCSSHFENIIT